MKTIFRCLAVLFLFHSSLFSQDTSTVKYLPLKVGIRVNIIESRYSSHSHNFDSIWHHVATAVGCSCNIVPYSFLDDTSNIENTDILIISAGCITIPMYGTRIETIKKYLTHGRNVYFQTEYSSTMTTNYAFSYIVNQLGGSFTWTMTVGGNLHPMNILGSLSHIPNFVPSIDYFWYGCAGLGDSTIENFMEYEGNYFGFIFTPPNLSYGEMIISSDQDWIGHGTSKPLMQNILYRLGNTITGGKKSAQNIPVEFALYQNYPNPFNPITKIKYESPKSNFVRLIVFNVLGQEVAELVNEQLKPGTYEVKWDGSNYPSGVYFYKLVTADFTETRKMILLK